MLDIPAQNNLVSRIRINWPTDKIRGIKYEGIRDEHQTD